MQPLDNNDRTITSIESLIEDADFERLNQLLSEHTVFDILGISTDELVHSRMLFWLLDPAASHGLGDRMVRRFIYTTAKTARSKSINFGNDGLLITPLQAATFTFSDVQLRSE